MGNAYRLLGPRGAKLSLIILSTLGSPAPAWAAIEEEDASAVPAVIMRVEGEGIAKVKKAIGTEEVAGANGKIFPGDRVITDEKSTVFLMINDGSMIKVGLSSEFKVEQTKLHERFMSWAFGLAKGSMRAMVEKNPNPDVRFKVNTPSGTIGVRGTEFVVAVDEESKSSYLYTIEGLVSYGSSGCEKDNTCVDVRAGETASLKTGETRPAKPQPYHFHEMFGLNPATKAPAKPAVADNRMSLFRDAKKVTARYMQDTDEAALKKLVLEASEALAISQDQAIGRSKSERVAMQNAIKDGTFNDTIAAANAYAEQNGIFEADINGGAEDLVSQTNAAKFRLGLAVKDAVSAGIFEVVRDEKKSDEDKWDAADLTKPRKHVEYEKADRAKGMKAKLAELSDDYKKVLEFAEAQPAKKAEDLAATPEKNSEASSKGSVVRSDKRGEGKRNFHKRRRLSSCDRACRVRRVANEVQAMSEGVVAAFNENRSAAGNGYHSQNTDRPGRLTKVDKGVISSRYFKKAIPGDACYNEVKDCKLVLCKGHKLGKTCKKGESVQECTTKRTPARCPEKD